MKYKGLLTDRMKLVEAIERETGQKAVYGGAPGFKYTIGNHTVLRNGSLETADAGLVKKLVEEGLIEGTQEPKAISFPMEGFTGRSLVNLVNSFAAREKLLNKALAHPNAFHMGAGLVRELKTENPATIGEFMDVLHACGGEKAIRGIRLTGSTVSFPGFPDTPACRSLAELMVRAAAAQGWVKPTSKPAENEKYSFRVWLNALGMIGPQYKEARTELLKHFEGDSAYKTEEQKEAFYRKRRKASEESEFIVL